MIPIYCFLSILFCNKIFHYFSATHILFFVETWKPSATLTAVQTISRQGLVEIRAMANPPVLVKLTVEAVCTMLGETTTDWKALRQIIARETFIPTVIQFKSEDIRYIRSGLLNLMIRCLQGIHQFIHFHTILCVLSTLIILETTFAQ